MIDETTPLRSEITNALPISSTVGNYNIIAILAEDDFSISYKATDTVLGIPVFVKEYLPKSIALRNRSMPHVMLKNIQNAHCYQSALTQYLEETNKLLNLYHPNIANVRACIEANNTVYSISDFIEGNTLDYYVKEELFPEQERIKLLEPLLDGLQAIHEAGFYHGALNPSTIIIKENTLIPIITHLGSEKYVIGDQKVDLSSSISTDYSPHKQYTAHSTQDVPTDIYAMGAILYYIISDITPNSLVQRLTATLADKQDPLIPASLIAQGRYSEMLLLAIDHAMESQETDRPTSVEVWKKELGMKKSSYSSSLKKIAHLAAEKKRNNPNTPKRLEIDFSVLKQPLSTRQKTERHQYAMLIAITTIMLGVLIAGVASYNPLLNKAFNDEKTNKIKDLNKLSLVSALQQKSTLSQVNLTTISTIIENFYRNYSDTKPSSFSTYHKSRNNEPAVLISRIRRNNTIKKVINEDIAIRNLTQQKYYHQTGRADPTKYKLHIK